jgi:hypothetical protein
MGRPLPRSLPHESPPPAHRPGFARLPKPDPGTQTVRRTAHVVRRETLTTPPEPGVLSAASRSVIRRHLAESRQELPVWAYRDLIAVMDTADMLEDQLRAVRSCLAQCSEALRIASRVVAEAGGIASSSPDSEGD